MIPETFSLSLPVAGFFLISIQSIKQMENIYSSQPKGLFRFRVCVSLYSPKADTWPWVQLWPCWDQGDAFAALQRSSPTSSLEISSDFTDKIRDGIPVLTTVLWCLPGLSTCGSCLWKSVQELNWILSQAPAPNLLLCFQLCTLCALQSHVDDGKK